MKKIDYKLKKKHELEWWSKKNNRKNIIGRLLNSRLFYNRERCHFSYTLSKNQMNKRISNYLRNQHLERILIAPCGEGDDYRHIKEFSDEIFGIDLSPDAIEKYPKEMKVKSGDILIIILI